MTETENRSIQIESELALGKIGDKRVLDSIILLLRENDENIQQREIHVLGEIGDKRAVEPLTKLISHTTIPVRIKSEAVIALEKLEDEIAVEPLLEVLKHDDIIVAMHAKDALVKIGKPAVGPLVREFKDKSAMNWFLIFNTLVWFVTLFHPTFPSPVWDHGL